MQQTTKTGEIRAAKNFLPGFLSVTMANLAHFKGLTELIDGRLVQLITEHISRTELVWRAYSWRSFGFLKCLVPGH